MTRRALWTVVAAGVLVATLVATTGVAAENGTVTIEQAIDRTAEVSSLLEKRGAVALQVATGGLLGLGIGLAVGAGVTYKLWQGRIA